MVLLPEEVAVLITGYQRSPRLINARPINMLLLERIVGRSDVESRRELSKFVMNNAPVEKILWFLNEIDARGIKLICFRQKLSDDYAPIREGFVHRGFAPHQVRGYEIWISQRNGL